MSTGLKLRKEARRELTVTRERFEHELTRAKTLQQAGDRPQYWAGYIRGLKEVYHGRKFGIDEEHEAWLSLVIEEGLPPVRVMYGRLLEIWSRLGRESGYVMWAFHIAILISGQPFRGPIGRCTRLAMRTRRLRQRPVGRIIHQIYRGLL